jgi:hypothetical protein
MDGSTIAIWGALIVGLALSLGSIIWLGTLTQNKDNGAEIAKQLGIIAGIVAIAIIALAIFAYIYFSTNVTYLSPFLLITTFINMFLSLFAVSAATLQITNS